MNPSRMRRWSLDRRARRKVSASRSQGEPFVSRLFRRLRRLEQFGRMFFQSAYALVRQVPGGFGQSTAAILAQYKDLANSLELPDRPMLLSKFERAVPGEATLIARMARVAAHAVIENYCATKISDCFANAMRDQHAKSHGCVKAEFIVRDDLPDGFTTSLFRPGARYSAVIRFSNGLGKPQSDKKIDARGMAIKLCGVDTATLLRTLAPDRTHAGEHDFVLSSFPVFFCKDAVDYSELMDAVSAPSRTWSERFSKVKRWFLFAVWHPRQFVTFLLTAVVSLVTIRNPLTATYHSMSPYLFGDDKVVRYVVRPEHRRNNFVRWWTFPTLPSSVSFLLDDLWSVLYMVMHSTCVDSALLSSLRVRLLAFTDQPAAT